jgi:IS6 family transposase
MVNKHYPVQFKPDAVALKVNGVWRYVYRAIDQHGQVIDVLLTVHGDAEAARRARPVC